ncbi:hypothetical protein [Paenibacillus oleatilyticus]|uniref:hypothetical protein n=1 Tax=Paenibacillus oleatilyticus TaxID=2594886 RepID=UPI001C1FA2F4|nr:hypothetical protein [Paenibacillus oleatilyticus]MBU7318561.1 hypothetical protein [Paenibacillus oleatilyticus]
MNSWNEQKEKAKAVAEGIILLNRFFYCFIKDPGKTRLFCGFRLPIIYKYQAHWHEANTIEQYHPILL